jgi:pilus assembly protein CpaF
MSTNYFSLNSYLETANQEQDTEKKDYNANKNLVSFYSLCKKISQYFLEGWESEQGKDGSTAEQLLEYQKKAIIGYPSEINYFISRIETYLRKNNLMNTWYPTWHENLTSAIFHENWGLAGIAPWKNIKESSSSKIIGEKIFFLINGSMQLQQQQISGERLKQLRKALLLRNPEIHLSNKYAEVYMLDGTRITIFEDAKEPTIVFRKYIIEQLNFEEQAKRGTIPEEIIPLLKAKIKIGYNVNFIGPVRSGKTTFLETWQSYEDKRLEGVLIETDPEIPLHKIMPEAPIIQIIADDERLNQITKSLMRSDADYFILAEARDAVALNLAVKITTKGTRRVKSTYHSADATDFVYDAANEIIAKFGGDLQSTMIKLAKGYHYLYEFIQLHDRSKKRLKGVYELRYDAETRSITIHQIIKYDYKTDDWFYKFDIGRDKEEIALQEEGAAYETFSSELKKLAIAKPLVGEHVTRPFYGRVREG